MDQLKNTGCDQPGQLLRCGDRLVSLAKPLVMGIVNVTPDSFWVGSRTPDTDSLEARIIQMREEGADIIDVGGCSTRPGATLPTPQEELARLRRGLEAIRRVWPEAIISVDTFRADIARICVNEFDIDIINDVSGGEADSNMFETVASLQKAYVLTHAHGVPANPLPTTDEKNGADGNTTTDTPDDDIDVVADVLSYLAHRADRLRDLGVCDIILDPGFGFGKTVSQNYRLLEHLDEFMCTGMPVLAGLSRKSMIWRPLGLTPADSLNATTALNMVALERGASILRVHDVRHAKETVSLHSLLSPIQPPIC